MVYMDTDISVAHQITVHLCSSTLCRYLWRSAGTDDIHLSVQILICLWVKWWKGEGKYYTIYRLYC